MTNWFSEIATSGPLVVAIAVSALAGAISFLSPCVLPLVPGYLSYITGLAGKDMPGSYKATPSAGPGGGISAPPVIAVASRRATRQVLVGSLGFIAGFTIVFVTVNIAVTTASRSLLANTRLIEAIAGTLTIVLGIGYLGLIPALQREVRLSRLPSPGLWGAPLLGITFALSWAPCVTPTLAAVIGLASSDGTADRAAILALAYCAGLGLPFLATGLGISWVLSFAKVVRRHNQWVIRIGGVMLILVGLALVTGAWQHFTIWLKVLASGSQFGI